VPSAVPPAFAGAGLGRCDALVAALTGGARTGSPVAHGWCAFGRLPARAFSQPAFQPVDPGSLRYPTDARVPLIAFALGAQYTRALGATTGG
jgi:hypothetical protein